MRPLLTLYTLSTKFFFLPCHQYIWARDIIVQSLGSCKRKKGTIARLKTSHLILNNYNYSLSAWGAKEDHWTSTWQQITHSQNSGYTAQNPFHYLTQLEVQLWTVPLSWWLNHTLSSCVAVHWLPLDFDELFRSPASNTRCSFIYRFFFRKRKSTCPKFQKIYKK